MKCFIFRLRMRVAHILWMLLCRVCPMPMHVLLTVVADPAVRDLSLSKSA